jgi:hypothetical protein
LDVLTESGVLAVYYCVHLLLPELLERPGPVPSSASELEAEPEPEPGVAGVGAPVSAVDGGVPWVVVHYLGPEKELDSL